MSDFISDREQWIMRFLDGELSPSELEEFNQKLATDPILTEEVSRMRLAIETTKYYGTRDKVRAIHQEMRKEVVPVQSKVVPFRRVIRYSMAVAASILLIFLAVQTYYFYKLSPEGLYKESYIAYNVGSLRTPEVTELSPIEAAYSNKQHDQVIQLAKDNQDLSDKDRFLAGLSFLETNDNMSAIKWFEKLNRADNPYREDAQFYLSLSYLRNKDYDKAIDLMQSINQDTTHTYHNNFSRKYISKVKLLKWR